MSPQQTELTLRPPDQPKLDCSQTHAQIKKSIYGELVGNNMHQIYLGRRGGEGVLQNVIVA